VSQGIERLTSTPEIKNLPSIPGVKFRLFQGASDYAPMASVITASELADHSDRSVTEQDLAGAYQNRLINCDPYQDMIFAEVAGIMVGYNRGWWEHGETNQRSYIHHGFLVPEWRRKGIGRAMLFWMEQRLQKIAETHPPDIEKLFEVSVSQFQTGASILLERSGYQPVHYFYQMLRPTLDHIPELPLPDGLEVRPATPDHYLQIWQSSVECSQDEWGDRDLTEQDYLVWLARPEFQPELWQVAWDVASNQVAGQVLTYIQHEENKQYNHKRGYTESMGVRRPWRRLGLARALISRSLQAQKAAGMTESALVVDTDNPSGAVRLYQDCGFQVAKRDTLYSKPLVKDRG
jgi:mycothiol synthase